MTDSSLSPAAVVGPIDPSNGRWRPLGLEAVRLTGGYWASWQRLNTATMINHCFDWIERLGWSGNFDAVARGDIAEVRQGREFSDSEVYKLMEAMAWEVGRTDDQSLEAKLRGWTDRVAAAQDEDGYLSTMFGHEGQRPRYSDLMWGHELYCYGHLIQAGVARGRTAGPDDQLVRVAVKVADHVCREFGANGNQGYCGHPEIESALVELHRLTGERRYLNQARLFINRRGNGRFIDAEIGLAYFQDDMHVREADVLRGHAVRALYLQSGVIDQAVEDQDRDLLELAASQMARTLARRTYITGGMGSRHEGEAFGDDWELPSDRAYCETCAGVASIMANHRLLLATGDPRSADAVERALFNIIATSPAADGRSFYYSNRLRQTVQGEPSEAEGVSLRAGTGLRAPWFEVSCCPNNLTRTFASLGAYIASLDDDGIQIHQWADAEIKTVIAGGGVKLRIETDYPDSGHITIMVVETPGSSWTLSLRVPIWAVGAQVTTAQGAVAAPAGKYATVTRAFAPGDKVRLDFEVTARWTWPDRRIDGIRGSVAVERGPVVMALESIDLGADVGLALVRTDAMPVDDDGQVLVPISLMADPDVDWAYSDADQSRRLFAGSARLKDTAGTPTDDPTNNERLVPLVPYHDWAQRGPSTMRVWLPTL